MWKATILSFPSLWSKLVACTSTSQSNMLTIVGRSDLHPLRVMIPCPALSDPPQDSIRYKHIDLVVKLLPRISRLAFYTYGERDTFRIYRAFKDRHANQLRQFSFTADPGLSKLFVLHSPQLKTLCLYRVRSWPASVAENLTHVQFDCPLDPETMAENLKLSPRLKQIRNIWQLPNLQTF